MKSFGKNEVLVGPQPSLSPTSSPVPGGQSSPMRQTSPFESFGDDVSSSESIPRIQILPPLETITSSIKMSTEAFPPQNHTLPPIQLPSIQEISFFATQSENHTFQPQLKPLNPPFPQNPQLPPLSSIQPQYVHQENYYSKASTSGPGGGNHSTLMMVMEDTKQEEVVVLQNQMDISSTQFQTSNALDVPVPSSSSNQMIISPTLRPRRPHKESPLRKLTCELLKTYRHINEVTA